MGGLLDQSVNAIFAFSTARSTSALEARFTLKFYSPVAGLKTLLVLFEEPSKSLPSTKCFIILITYKNGLIKLLVCCKHFLE